MQVCKTATSQYHVNNYNYHSNASYFVLHVRKEPEECKYASSTEVSFNATSGCQQREQLLLDLIRSRELKELGQGPEEHSLIH